MSVTIELSDEQAATLEAYAREEGISVPELLHRMAEERGHPRAESTAQGQKLVDVCAKVKGLTDDLDFSRNRSTARSLDQ